MSKEEVKKILDASVALEPLQKYRRKESLKSSYSSGNREKHIIARTVQKIFQNTCRNRELKKR